MSIDSLPSGAVLDVAGTLVRFGGDRQLFQEIIGFFLEDSPPLFADLQRAANESDAQGVRSAAHALKGLAAGCGGVRAAQAAQRIENAGQDCDLEDIASLIEVLDGELEQLRRAAAACRL